MGAPTAGTGACVWASGDSCFDDGSEFAGDVNAELNFCGRVAEGCCPSTPPPRPAPRPKNTQAAVASTPVSPRILAISNARDRRGGRSRGAGVSNPARGTGLMSGPLPAVTGFRKDCTRRRRLEMERLRSRPVALRQLAVAAGDAKYRFGDRHGSFDGHDFADRRGVLNRHRSGQPHWGRH